MFVATIATSRSKFKLMVNPAIFSRIQVLEILKFLTQRFLSFNGVLKVRFVGYGFRILEVVTLKSSKCKISFFHLGDSQVKILIQSTNRDLSL